VKELECKGRQRQVYDTCIVYIVDSEMARVRMKQHQTVTKSKLVALSIDELCMTEGIG